MRTDPAKKTETSLVFSPLSDRRHRIDQEEITSFFFLRSSLPLPQLSKAETNLIIRIEPSYLSLYMTWVKDKEKETAVLKLSGALKRVPK